MTRKTTYEWDIETVSEHGDVLDHNHADMLDEFGANYRLAADERVVLVRDVFDDLERLVDRTWAYVEDGELPVRFADSLGEETTNVPKRFHREYKNWRYLTTLSTGAQT